MHRIRTTRPRKRPGHYAFASALKHSIEVSRLTHVTAKQRRLSGPYGHPQYL